MKYDREFMGKSSAILFLITELDVGGAERMLLDLCRGVQKNGKFRVHVGYFHGGGRLAADFAKFEINVIAIKSFWQLLRIIRKNDIGLIHTHLIWADVYGIIAAKLSRIKVMTTKHSTNYFFGKSNLFYFIDACLNRLANRIIGVSHTVKNFYVAKEKINDQKMGVIYNGIDVEYYRKIKSSDFRERMNINPQAKVVTTIASFTPQKGYPYMLKAAQRIIAEMDDVCFVWVGEGSLFSAFQKNVAQLKCDHRIKFTGTVMDVRPILATTDLFAIITLWNGFGLVLLEAMARGLPIIGSDVIGVREILGDEESVILVEPGNEDALYRALQLQLKREYTKAISYHNIGKFTVDAMVQNYSREYEALV